jgi:hypothetical protein
MLRWDDTASGYRCGALTPVCDDLSGATSAGTRSLGTRLRAQLVGRLIAAGKGCDCDVELDPT